MHKILKYINIALIIVCGIISINIFTNKSYNLGILNSLYNTYSNFIRLQVNDQNVSSSLNYIKIDEYKYYNDSCNIISPFNGSVIEVNDKKLLIKCENGYNLVFENIINIQVRKFDIIDTNDIIAYFIDDFIMYFYKDNVRCSYEEIISYS